MSVILYGISILIIISVFGVLLIEFVIKKWKCSKNGKCTKVFGGTYSNLSDCIDNCRKNETSEKEPAQHIEKEPAQHIEKEPAQHIEKEPAQHIEKEPIKEIKYIEKVQSYPYQYQYQYPYPYPLYPNYLRYPRYKNPVYDRYDPLNRQHHRSRRRERRSRRRERRSRRRER
jgi:hypothetical protein